MRKRLADNLETVRCRIGEAAARAGRKPSDVTLVAVTKSVDPEVIRALLDLGVTDLAESRVMQLLQRSGMIGEQLARRSMLEGQPTAVHPHWHMIGHLQRNKVKPLLPVVSMIHSVDTLRLAEEIHTYAHKVERRIDVLVEVNCSGEEQKYGMPVAAAGHFIEQILAMDNVRVCGLMTMAHQTADPEETRPLFERLYELFLELKVAYRLGKEFHHLSMGMSQDYQVAVECGATMVRVGSALFEGIEMTPAAE